jgi:hypothetical protein
MLPKYVKGRYFTFSTTTRPALSTLLPEHRYLTALNRRVRVGKKTGRIRNATLGLTQLTQISRGPGRAKEGSVNVSHAVICTSLQ